VGSFALQSCALSAIAGGMHKRLPAPALRGQHFFFMSRLPG
jgi:hypothetical protein